MLKHHPKPPCVFEQPTPGCGCTHCQNLKRVAAGDVPSGLEQMGRTRRFAEELGWADTTEERKGSARLRPNELDDRMERLATGRPLPAAYRSMLGPAPVVSFGDRQAALLFLLRIKAVLAHGGWTRSEWARLYRMRDKWQARAIGDDPRYEVVGNKVGGTLPPLETANVKQRKIVSRMMKELANASRKQQGD